MSEPDKSFSPACQFRSTDCALEGARGIPAAEKRNFMMAISRVMTTTLSVGLLATLFVSKVSAGCGDLSKLQGPFDFVQPSVNVRLAPLSVAAAKPAASASIVGMWYVKFVSQGNTTHSPAIPDGAILDFGFNQWHNDGTEILNSGAHAPATENFCLGVWGQTGFLTYELNHFALSYDATTGALANVVNIREQDTLSPSGDSYTGTFTLDIYDTKGNKVDHLGGNMLATRVTVDSPVTAVP
jgi:hypothetical protein